MSPRDDDDGYARRASGSVRAVRPTRRAHALACAIFVVATLIVFGDVLIAGDGRSYSTPIDDQARTFFFWEFAFRELWHGHLVLWNPHNYSGAPFFAGFQPGLLYPPNWLHMVLPVDRAANLGIALNVLIAGLGMYCWTVHRRLHPAACILAGLVFMFCGTSLLQIYSGHLPQQRSLTWTPFILLAIDGAVGERPLPWVLLGAAAVAMQIFAGHVQYVYYTALLAVPYALAQWITAPRRFRAAVALTAIYLGGMALSGIQLVTGLDTLSEALRNGISWDVASMCPFPPENVLTLVFPGIFGDMIDTPYWGRWTLREATIFIGVAPFVLAVCGIVHGERRTKRMCLSLAMIALLIAFGSYTPLFAFLYAHMPGFQSLRAVARFAFLAVVFLAMLVAVGFDYLLRVERPPRWLALGSVVLGVVLLSLGVKLHWDCRAQGQLWNAGIRALDFLAEARQNFASDTGMAHAACANTSVSLLVGGAIFATVGILLFAMARWRRLAYVIAIIGALELLTYAHYALGTFDTRPLLERRDALRRALAEAHVDGARVHGHDPHQYLALGAGGDDIGSSCDLVLERYARFIALTQGWPFDGIIVTSGVRKLSPLLGMLRLRYFVDVDGTRVRLLPTNLPELPRATLVPHWRVVPSADEALAALAQPGFDPANVVLLESEPGLTPSTATAAPGTVSVTDLSTETMDVTADVATPSVLLISDNYSSGWKAIPYDDSSAHSYRVLPADYTLRGIPLDVGRHHFRLEYRPTAFTVGAWLSGVTWIAFLAALVVAWRTRSAGHDDSTSDAPAA